MSPLTSIKGRSLMTLEAPMRTLRRMEKEEVNQVKIKVVDTGKEETNMHYLTVFGVTSSC